MTLQEISQIITLARRAPLANMAEAEAASVLLQKLAQHFAPKVGDIPVNDARTAESPDPAMVSKRGEFRDGCS